MLGCGFLFHKRTSLSVTLSHLYCPTAGLALDGFKNLESNLERHYRRYKCYLCAALFIQLLKVDHHQNSYFSTDLKMCLPM